MNVDTLHSNNECDDDGCTRMISSWWWELTRRGDKQHDKMRCILLTTNELAKLWTLNRMFGTEIDQSIDDFSFSIRHCLDTMSLKGKDTRKKKKRKKIHDLTYRKSYRKLHFFFFYSTHSASFLSNNNFLKDFSSPLFHALKSQL